MAGPDLKVRIGLDGEQEFRQAINELNNDLRVSASEMRKVTAQYQDNANSIEALTAKGEVLADRLGTQERKVIDITSALKHAEEEYGRNSEEARKWTKELNYAQAQVYDTEAAIRKNNEALERAEKGTYSFGDALDVVSDKLGIKLPKDLERAADRIGNFSGKAISWVGAIAVAVAGLAGTYQKLFNMATEAGANADNILKLSQITGLDTNTIQEMQYASELINVSFETIKSSMTRLKNHMQDARDGNEKLQKAFETLGVSVSNTDGTLRRAEDVFYETIDALGLVENATERDALAMDIFGRRAEELNPLIVQGSDRLRELAAEAENVGYVMDSDTLDALKAVDDEAQRMQKQFESLKNQIGAQFAPAAVAAMQIFSDAVTKTSNILLNSGIIEYFGNAIQGFGYFLGISGTEDEYTPDSNGMYGSNWYNPETGLWEGNYSHRPMDDYFYDKETGRIWNSTKQRWVDDYSTEIWGHSGYHYSPDGTLNGFIFDRTRNRYYNASGNYNFAGGRTMVGENGPEEVELPAGTRIYNAQETAQRSGGDVFIFNIDAKNVHELNRLVSMAESARIERRMR